MWENGPEKVEKKNTVAHSTPDVTPRNKNKFGSSGVLNTGSIGSLIHVSIRLSKISILDLLNMFL